MRRRRPTKAGGKTGRLTDRRQETQFKGELKELKMGAKRWKNEIHIGVTYDSAVGKSKVEEIRKTALDKGVYVTEYMKLPWEIEAYAMQETLLIEWNENGWK